VCSGWLTWAAESLERRVQIGLHLREVRPLIDALLFIVLDEASGGVAVQHGAGGVCTAAAAARCDAAHRHGQKAPERSASTERRSSNLKTASEAVCGREVTLAVQHCG